jgi:phenylacetate-CoA ligase
VDDALRRRQLDRLRAVLDSAVPGNRFLADKLHSAGVAPADLTDPAAFARLPFTTKAELAAEQAAHPPYGRLLSFPPDRYTRLHQTSGTSTGRPLRWLDTAEGWDWLLSCWRAIFPRIGLAGREVLFFPFSFGPFLGFWTAFEAAAGCGHLCLPGGGMTSTARLRMLLEHRATAVFATPTYALHLAEVAAAEGIDLATSAVRAVVVAGEPGGTIPATRARIEAVWGARVFDHYGMTEVGPVAVEPADRPGGLEVLEEHHLAEVLEPDGDRPVPVGEVGELVLTNLGRVGSPVVRYRTGDLVRVGVSRTGGLRMEGGVLGRADDMIHVRGNNLYPAAVEAIVRRFATVAEFRLVLDRSGPLADLRLEVEPVPDADGPAVAAAVATAIQDELLFRTAVRPVPPGSLPRFEMKARRIVKTDR